MSGPGVAAVIVTLPWPPRILSPNARAHWAAKAMAAKGYKSACWFLCLQAKAQKLQAGTFSVVVTFCPPDQRGGRRQHDRVVQVGA